jgi:hypothetical protein
MRSFASTSTPLSIRDAVSCAAATLVAYVGVVHEVVGATLYPEGPLQFGGPIVWHSAGLAGIAAGLWLAAGALRLLPVPGRLLAAAVGLIGGVVFAAEALLHGGFHFFAFTLVVAGGVLVIAERATTPLR